VNNGGDYVASRRGLLRRYAVRWLLALHDQDTALYAALIYDICSDMAEDGAVKADFGGLQSGEDKKVIPCTQLFGGHRALTIVRRETRITATRFFI
jgi:hypothetical protein